MFSYCAFHLISAPVTLSLWSSLTLMKESGIKLEEKKKKDIKEKKTQNNM